MGWERDYYMYIDFLSRDVTITYIVVPRFRVRGLRILVFLVSDAGVGTTL